MKSLKKILTLVLVVAMVLSIGAIGASAAFTDTTSSKYTEAIDVLAGIGVINGTTSTTYNPTGSLTRESAAKIIAYLLLGPTNAQLISNATSQKFSDVAPTRWSAGYVEYCANLGIIAGTGDGTFVPEGTLTTVAFTKMLLCALGYKADAEGLTGSSWAINTAALAVTAGVYDSRIAISSLNACSRDEAAQLAFKVLTANAVQYTGGTTITIGDSTITTGATRSFVANAAVSQSINTDAYMQFAEQHFPLLTKSAASPDDFGRPGVITWTNLGTYIASALPTATKTYTTAVTGAKIFADLGLAVNKTATVYTDGVHNKVLAQPINYNGVTDVYGGAGALTEVYYNIFTGAIDIVVINTYYGTVTAVTPATAVSKANVTVAPGTTKVTAFAGGAFNTTGFAVNNVIVYTVAQTDATTFIVKSVTAATKATLAATSYVANASFVAGGTTYMYSAKLEGGLAVGDFTAHDVYFDTYGNVIFVTGATSTANYAVVLAAGTSSDGLGSTTNNVKLLMTDGTQKVAVSTTLATVGSIVTYTVSSTTGVYTLTDATSTDYSAQTLAVTKGVSGFSWNSAPYYGNANTVYLVRTGAPGFYTYTAYTGTANVPSLTGSATGQVVKNATTGFAAVVYVENATVASTASGTVYLTGTYSTTVDSTLGTYYTSNAIVDGLVKTVNLGATPTKGLYTGITYNAGGIGTIGTLASPINTATGTKAAANDVIGLGTAYYSYAPNCAVYYISTVAGTAPYTGIGSVSSISGLLTDTTDTVTFTKDLAGVVTAVYVEVVTGA